MQVLLSLLAISLLAVPPAAATVRLCSCAPDFLPQHAFCWTLAALLCLRVSLKKNPKNCLPGDGAFAPFLSSQNREKKDLRSASVSYLDLPVTLALLFSKTEDPSHHLTAFSTSSPFCDFPPEIQTFGSDTNCPLKTKSQIKEQAHTRRTQILRGPAKPPTFTERDDSLRISFWIGYKDYKAFLPTLPLYLSLSIHSSRKP